MSIFDAAMAYADEGTAADDPRRQGVRQRVEPRLGRQGRPSCSACARCWPRASSASTAPTWWAWACCRCSTCRASRPTTYGLDGTETFSIEGLDPLNRGETVRARARRRPPTPRARSTASTCACASTRPPRPSTTATAACSTSCCASWRPSSPLAVRRGSPRRRRCRRSLTWRMALSVELAQMRAGHRVVGAGDRDA